MAVDDPVSNFSPQAWKELSCVEGTVLETLTSVINSSHTESIPQPSALHKGTLVHALSCVTTFILSYPQTPGCTFYFLI